MSGSSAFQDWIDEARGVSIEQALAGRATALKPSGVERIGPCPVCGGRDGFSIHPGKRVFNCRRGGVGGDAIALVQHLDGCEFLVACEILNGRPPPDRARGETPEARAERERAQAVRQRQAAQDEARKTEEANRFRERERRACWQHWDGARRSLAGTPAEAYLRCRGLVVPEGAALRCAPEHDFFERLTVEGSSTKANRVIHSGPALLAAIRGPNGKFAGLHATWLDATGPSGKLEIFHPETGELLPAKKVRGSATGGHIPLVRHAAPTDLVLGEGIETVLSVWRALSAAGWEHLAGAAFWAAYSLGNIGGAATKSVPHPSETQTDSLGRVRARLVPGPVPDLSRPSLPIPASVERVWLLGDGDSERVRTENALHRGAVRFRAQRPGRQVVVCWAPAGEDFNDVLRRAAA